MPPLKDKDRLFYGWIIVIVVVLIGMLTFGTRNAFGVFFKSFEGEFELSRAMTSGIFALHQVISAIFVIAAGWFLDKYGPKKILFLFGTFTGLSLVLTSMANYTWHIYITYSLLLAFGAGAAYPVLMATVSRWFVNKRGSAMGIAGCGGPMGQITMAPMATYIILNYGWRTAFLVIGLIAGTTVMSLSLLLKKGPVEIGTIPSGKNTGPDDSAILGNIQNTGVPPPIFSIRQLIARRSYWFLWSIGLFQGFCIFLAFTHIIPHSIDKGMTEMTAAVVLSLMVGTSILGRLIMGFASDRIGRVITIVICSLGMSASMLWLIWANNIWGFYLFSVVFGFTYGGFNPTILTMITDVFGTLNIGIIMSTLSVGFTLGSAIGPYAGGIVFDIFNNYSLAFILGATLIFIAGFLATLVKGEILARIT